MNDHAQWQVGLHAGASVTTPQVGVSGWKNRREAGRKRDTCFAGADQLIAVIEQCIAESGPVRGIGARPPVHQRVAELMALSPDRPFLREGVGPIAAVQVIGKRVDVLDHALFLVVRLFHQKTVVLDRGRLLGKRWKAKTKDEDQNKHRERAHGWNHFPDDYEIEIHFHNVQPGCPPGCDMCHIPL